MFIILKLIILIVVSLQISEFCISTAGENVEQLQDPIKDLEKHQYLPHY